MKYKLSDICEYAKGKIKVSVLDENTYISTENMLPNKGGIAKAASLWEKFSDTCLEVFESMEVNGKRTFGYDVPIIYKRV